MQKCPFCPGIPQGSFLVLLYISTIYYLNFNTTVLFLLTLFYYKFDWAFNLRQQPVMVCKLKYNLWDTMDWSEIVLFSLSNTFLYATMHGFSRNEKSSFNKVLRLSFSSKLDWGSKTASEKIALWRFFLLKLCFISINKLSDFTWNTIFMHGLVLPFSTLRYWTFDTASFEPLALPPVLSIIGVLLWTKLSA